MKTEIPGPRKRKLDIWVSRDEYTEIEESAMSGKGKVSPVWGGKGAIK